MFSRLKNLFAGASSNENTKQFIDKGAIIIDVRTPYEFKQGHLPGSKNIPLDTIASRVNELRKLNKPIITVCRSGARSSSAKDILINAGFDVCNGGAWSNLRDA